MPLEESTTASASDREVVVDSRRFHPTITAVPAGTTVTWTNRDGVPHSIVSAERHFTSPVLDADERFSRRFDVPGTYTYSCSLHPKLTGQIVVG